MKFAIAVVLAVAVCHVSAAPSTVSSSLLQKLRAEGVSDAIIVLKDEVSSVVERVNSRRFTNSAEKTTVLVNALRERTRVSQKAILSTLSTRKAAVTAFWITNRIFVPQLTLQELEVLSAEHGSEIAEIREQIIATIDYESEGIDANPQVLEWGVDNINAPEVWTEGAEGEGIVVSHIDTGVRATHEALAGALRETHNWLDPYSNAQTPDDDNGHGTHTMGTIVGRDGTGVAPKATYISCRGCESAGCTEAALLSCGQWTTCPTNSDGSDEDCSKKPVLSSNSWGGGNENTWYNDVIAAWQAASIVPVFAIGNSGPGCRSANSPGDQRNVISVGATNAQNAVASFSSHGPTLLTARIKPEVSAPGNQVRSAWNTGDAVYNTISGTSMATPHVAGTVALLLSKNSALTFAQIETLLEENALRPRIENIICTGGGVNITNPWPNNSFGHGKIDAKASFDAAPSA